MNDKSSMTHLSCNFMALLAWKWAIAIGHLQHQHQGKLMLWLLFAMWNLKKEKKTTENFTVNCRFSIMFYHH